MKTFNFRAVVTIILTAGLLLACSNDDDALTSSEPDPVVTPDPRGFSGQDIPVSVEAEFTLTSSSPNGTCGPSTNTYQHTGSGSSAVLGEFTAEISYCASANSRYLQDVELIIEDAENNQLFLSQVVVEEPAPLPGDPLNGDQVQPSSEFLVLEVTGGTGIFSGITGELSTRTTSTIEAGARNSSISLSGILRQQ